MKKDKRQVPEVEGIKLKYHKKYFFKKWDTSEFYQPPQPPPPYPPELIEYLEAKGVFPYRADLIMKLARKVSGMSMEMFGIYFNAPSVDGSALSAFERQYADAVRQKKISDVYNTDWWLQLNILMHGSFEIIRSSCRSLEDVKPYLEEILKEEIEAASAVDTKN